MYMYYIYVGECRVLPRYYGRSTNTAIANYYQLVVSLLHHIARDYFILYHLIVFKHNYYYKKCTSVCYDTEFSEDANFKFNRTRKDIDAI